MTLTQCTKTKSAFPTFMFYLLLIHLLALIILLIDMFIHLCDMLSYFDICEQHADQIWVISILIPFNIFLQFQVFLNHFLEFIFISTKCLDGIKDGFVGRSTCMQA